MQIGIVRCRCYSFRMTETWIFRLQIRMQRVLARFSYGITNYRHPLRKKMWAIVKSVPERIPTGATPLECAEIYQAVKACEKIPGDIAEAGVYRGGTAAIMLLASQQKRIHLFDTFAGLPTGEGKFEKGEWFGSLDDVKQNLSEWNDRTEYHPGLFPESAASLGHLRFSFVHLDLDLYESTRAALEWFWPRMKTGGLLLSHDYPISPGVVRAFDEFFAEWPEVLFPMTGNQCLVAKGVSKNDPIERLS